MKFLIQRVTSASCRVDHEITGEISKGFLVFIGVCDEDTKEASVFTELCLYPAIELVEE